MNVSFVGYVRGGGVGVQTSTRPSYSLSPAYVTYGRVGSYAFAYERVVVRVKAVRFWFWFLIWLSGSI